MLGYRSEDIIGVNRTGFKKSYIHVNESLKLIQNFVFLELNTRLYRVFNLLGVNEFCQTLAIHLAILYILNLTPLVIEFVD